MGFLPGWKSLKTVEAINSVFEYLETASLVVAIVLELFGMKRSSDVAWVALVISDIGRQVYGRREKKLSNSESNEEKRKVSELAQLLSYRSVGDLTKFTNAMRPFFGTKYVMEALVSAEGYSTNEVSTLRWQLATGLNNAGWAEIGPSRRRYNLGFGVRVYAATRQAEGSPGTMPDAGEALAAWLDGKKVATIPGLVVRDDINPGTLVIQIGGKPETTEHQEQILSEYVRLTSRPVTPPQAAPARARYVKYIITPSFSARRTSLCSTCSLFIALSLCTSRIRLR